ncbi:8-demethyl-8-aminoriboflavin-5'-phosphate (AFP) synthase RosB [Paraliobacillus quinghaiensis]|uniref:8-demethyl-8-aminoriboflavin-5'-phosphate (AFP) synthase RosB n=1 Tax=Paraliobacillus quinghaiensis TaxID=470815 RepID=A0A917WTX7_9BACI|nr:flavodoxin family protein [Paraliobacillus quinghaiensis]GGM28360.1 8-demethyl-8-aminoriboflavin-5'-phosphate (AFP) synthase RosB [Paraliobacillus quinghaiensis]
MSQIKALFLNASLKSSKDPSHTEALYEQVSKIYHEEEVETESLRLADYHIPFGISDDMGNGDEWPLILKKVKEANIVIIGTPVWLGEKSSLATVAIERLYGGSGLTNEKGQSIYYNKVGGVVITGNEDGAKHAANSVLYGLSHIGFVIPPNVDTYWVGEAGPGPSFIDANGKNNAFTQKHVEMLAYNTIYFAKLLQDNPIPAKGNVMEE